MIKELGLEKLSAQQLKNKIDEGFMSPHSEHISELAKELDIWSKKKSDNG